MAISNLGAINSLPVEQLPTGYTKPTVTTFSDWEYKRVLNLQVLKSTVETATPSATMTAIFNNATVGINKQIADIINADYLTTPTVTSYGELVELKLNTQQAALSDTTYLTNEAATYLCKVIVYVKAI